MLALGDSAPRKGADAMTFVGCDLHTRMQQVAVLDTRTGEVSERQLAHDGNAIEEFYAALPGPVTIGIESTGYAVWFHTLMQRLGHTVLVGDAAKIRAKLVRQAGLAQLHALALPPHTAQRRDQSLELLAGLTTQIRALDDAITIAALAHPDGPRLITHPGVGVLTALTTIVVLGPVARFHDSKHVVSYVGLAPALNASADKYHLGHITKQGSPLLRFALGQAAAHAARMDTDLKRTSFTLVHRRGRPKAKVAVARKLLVRLFIMLRDQIDYDEFQRRGRRTLAIASG